MRHLYRCPLRWADLDLLGHVNNVTYVDYLQEARVDMFRTHAPDSRAEDLAEGVVVVRHEVTYVSSLTFGFEPVSIECWVTEIRAASFTMAYEVFEEDEAGERTVFLRARTVLTPYVFATERPRRLHAEERESLGRLLEPDEPVRPPAAPQVVDVPGGHYPVHVRFSDVDVYGHVNNVKYFEYFQEARIQLMVAQRPRARPGLPPRRRADRRRLPAPDPLPRRALRLLDLGLAHRQHVGRVRVRRPRRRRRAGPREGGRRVHRQRDRTPGAGARGVPRHGRGRHSIELTMNWAAWVT